MEEEAENIGTVDNTPPQESLPGESPKWWIDEGVPGIGDRPQWLPEKFKNIKEAVNSGLELEKKLGTPPVSDYDFGEYAQDFDKNHEAFKELEAFAKEKRVPQEVFTKMLESVAKYGKSFFPEEGAEKAKLGADADRRLEVLNNWAKANLSQGSYEALSANLTTAEAVIAMEEVRAKMIGTTNPNIPNGGEPNSAATESVESLAKELSVPSNFEKYKTDEVYRGDWQRRNKEAVARAGGAGYVAKDGSAGY